MLGERGRPQTVHAKINTLSSDQSRLDQRERERDGKVTETRIQYISFVCDRLLLLRRKRISIDKLCSARGKEQHQQQQQQQSGGSEGREGEWSHWNALSISRIKVRLGGKRKTFPPPFPSLSLHFISSPTYSYQTFNFMYMDCPLAAKDNNKGAACRGVERKEGCAGDHCSVNCLIYCHYCSPPPLLGFNYFNSIKGSLAGWLGWSNGKLGLKEKSAVNCLVRTGVPEKCELGRDKEGLGN